MPHASTIPASIATPTVTPTRWPTPTSASERPMSIPVTALAPARTYRCTSPTKTFVATIAANAALAIELQTTVARPAAFSATAARSPVPPAPMPAPTRSTSAAATPSGYGRSLPVTIARRSGTLYMTPRIPPTAQIPNDSQNGNPVHQPTITSPGSTKMIDESVPAAEATVCTMLFSQIVALRNARNTAIEMTAAGIDEANVSPTFSPR